MVTACSTYHKKKAVIYNFIYFLQSSVQFRLHFTKIQACGAFICYSAVMDNYLLLFMIIFAVIFFHTTCQTSYGGNDMTTVVRRKRFVIFPRGSTFSVSYIHIWCADQRPIFLYTGWVRIVFTNFVCVFQAQK